MRNFDYSSLGERAWKTNVLSLLAEIHEYRGKQGQLFSKKASFLGKIQMSASIKSIGSSNQIEGIGTTRKRLELLVADKISPQNRDEEEIAGYREALKMVSELYPFIDIKSNNILQLHGILYRFSSKGIGGHYKSAPNFISGRLPDGTITVRFTPLDPFLVPDAMSSICESYNLAIDQGAVDPLLLIPVFIHDFLCIHPFADGNGRTSRLLTNLMLLKAGYEVGRYASIEDEIFKTVSTYYDALDASSKGWHEGNNDPLPFIEYTLGVILAAYRGLEGSLARSFDAHNAYEQVKDAVKGKIGRFSRSEIMELCPGLQKASVAAALKRLVEEGELELHSHGRSSFYTKEKN